jgi:iron complex transport system substrate-binding protein
VTSNWSRRRFLVASAATTASVALVAAGCAKPDKPGTVASDGSVTVKHAFGETKIPGPPKRVVSAGFTEQDDLLALGAVPIAITEWFGGEPFATWPWAQPRLGSAQPAVLTLDDGIQVDQIATLKPDLIVAINAGLDADTYTKLSGIAPTIAQSGHDAFFEPWRDQADTIGQALFQHDQMTGLIKAVDDRFTEAAKNNPTLNGKLVYVVSGTFFDDQAVVTPAGSRADYLTKLGLTVPTGADQYVHGDQAYVPRDKMVSVLDEADVLVWTTESDDETNALLADPTFAQLKATRTNHNVLTDKELAGAIAFGTVLSYPVVADRLPPLLAKVLA